jgi:hypothetical protein
MITLGGPVIRRAIVPVVLAALAALVGTPAAAAPACDDECRIDAARAYVEALATHDASAVSLHPEATRVEAGIQTGFSGEQIRRDLEHGPQYRVIEAVRDARFVADGETVVADFALDLVVPVVGSRVHEVFTFEDGRIRTIVADIALTARLSPAA